MIADLIRYSAVTAKARGMYGKRLTEEQWESLMTCRCPEDVREHLREIPSWAEAEQESDLLRGLDRQLERDCGGLCAFLGKKDSETLRIFLQQRGRTITPEEYQRWLGAAGKHGFAEKGILGAEADALNLVYILRLRGFPKSIADAEKYLIPLRDRLTPQLRNQILHAPTDGRVMEILSRTPWRDVFVSLEPGSLERQYRAAMTAYCRRVMTSAQPGMQVVQAFILLKDMERRRLVRLVGAVSRGIDPRLAIGLHPAKGVDRIAE